MDFVIDFLNVGSADAITVWIKDNGKDCVLFIDGGKTDDGKVVINHYNSFIAPHVKNPLLIAINSHPHADHINGLVEVVEHFKSEIRFAIYNDPIKYISPSRKAEIEKYYKENKDPDINHLYDLFDKVEQLNTMCVKYGISKLNASSNLNNNYGNLFKIFSPSEEYYKEKVNFFTDVNVLLKEDYTKKPDGDVNEIFEGLIPCKVVDEKNDVSPENLTSTVIQLTDSNNHNYLLTADAGVDSFESAEKNGFKFENYLLVQLPHHGSRRNVNTNWLSKFNPNFYVASADGSKKHPRKAVISCIKKNLQTCKVYSTHTCEGNYFIFQRAWYKARQHASTCVYINHSCIHRPRTLLIVAWSLVVGTTSIHRYLRSNQLLISLCPYGWCRSLCCSPTLFTTCSASIRL